jgi:hypothetical protein
MEVSMARSTTEQYFVETQISKVLSDAGIPTNNPALRSELERTAFVEMCGRDAAVRSNVNGRELSLVDRLNELRDSAQFKSAFPAPSRKVVDHRDMAQLRENFNDVAAGKVAVE